MTNTEFFFILEFVIKLESNVDSEFVSNCRVDSRGVTCRG